MMWTLPSARADYYPLAVDHCGGSGGCFGSNSNAGRVDVVQGANSNSVKIIVTLTSGIEFQEDSDPTKNNGATFTFNIDISNITISALTPGWIPDSGTPASGSRTDGFGVFGFGIACPNSGNGAPCKSGGTNNPSSVSFTITNQGGELHPADFAVLSSGGSPSAYFAADVIGNGNTGYVAAISDPPETPEPTSILFFGTGLLVAGWVLRRKFA